MNANCLVQCRFKNICKLDAEKTANCLYAKEKARLEDLGAGLVFGMTSEQINKMQGRDGPLK